MIARETRFQELKRYVSFSEVDAGLLADLGKVASSDFTRIAREFYDQIREHEDAHDVITSDEQIERLQGSLVRWMQRLCSGRYDEGYFDESTKIGRVHVHIGLPQRYLFTAMALIRASLSDIADERSGDAARSTRKALHRLLDIELAIMMDAHRQEFSARTARMSELASMKKLAGSARSHTDAFEHAGVLLVGLDAAGNIRLFNRQAERTTGFARDEVFGRSFADVFLTECADAFAALLRSDAPAATFIRTRAGKRRRVRMYCSRIDPQPPSDVVTFLALVDHTEEEEAEARARQTEKLAALGTLAAGLAHEIRNPLNGALLHVSFLARSLRTADVHADAKEAVGVIGDEIRRLANLVTEFLDFARSRPPALKEVSALALCKRVHGLLAAAAARAGVTLELDLPTRDVPLLADPAKLEQALLNLVQNAIEALQDRQAGTVLLKLRREPSHAVFDVIDDGPGLPKDGAMIFDPFFSTKPNGTGLGLPIAHRLVTDHHGSLSAEIVGGKTRFRISLPLRDPEERTT